MSAELRPRALVWRGRVSARGLLVERSLAAHPRILAVFEPGTVVHALADHYAVIWPSPRPVDARAQIGEPLVEVHDRLLSACPLEPRERVGPLATQHVAWAHAGALRLAAIDATTRVELGAWLELDEFVRADVRHLGPRPEPATLPELRVADADELLAGARPTPTAKRSKLLEALTRRAQRTGVGASQPGGSAGPTSTALALPERSGPTLAQRLWQRVAERVLGIDAIARAIGLRHARYLRETLELFDRGELDEALRRAIPASLLGDGTPKPPSLELPSPRRTLDIHGRSAAPTSGLGLSPDLFEHVRRRYAAAATQLERRGRVDEAAFVYFELLHDSLAGIALLERHGRYAMAAEIAEARELDPELVVRLWFLAKQPQRAILVARRTGAFAGAIAALERTHLAVAEELRLAWATHEAAAGDFVRAVEVLWASPSQRARALPWIDRALRYAGPSGRARMWGFKLDLQPDRFADIHAEIAAQLCGESTDALHLRLALALELSHGGPLPPAGLAIARTVARALLDDLDGPRDAAVRWSLSRLVEQAPLPVLARDLPKLGARPTPDLSQGTTTIEHQLPASDSGGRPAEAVAALPDGGALVALGEAGVVMLDRDGRVRARFRAPAHALVAPRAGSFALALARRDAFVQIWRLDLARETARWWMDLQLGCWANTHDCGHWFVADADALFALDLLAAKPTQLWRVPLVHERVEAIHVDETRLSALLHGRATHGPETLELFDFTLPRLTLRARTDLLTTFDFHRFGPPLLGPELIAWAGTNGFDHMLRIRDAQRTPSSTQDTPPGLPRACNREFIAVDLPRTLALQRRRDQQVVVLVRAPAAERIHCAIAGEVLWAADDLGRAWAISLHDGALTGPVFLS